MIPVLKIKITTGGKDYLAAPILAADMIALERHFDISAAEVLEGSRTEWWAYVGWHALSRQGERLGEFDKFASAVERVELVLPPKKDAGDDEDAEGKVPALNRAQRRASSRSSRSKPASRSGTSSSAMAGS